MFTLPTRMKTWRLRALLPLAAASGVLMAGRVVRADESALTPGVELGLRTGYSLPRGELQPEVRLKDAVSGQIPLIFDGGYRITPALYVGVLGQYGAGFAAKDCSGCTRRTYRIGVNAQYHFVTNGGLLPWAGVGAGYEFFTLSDSPNEQNGWSRYHGFELANAQAGVDFTIWPGLRVGPFASFSMGWYSGITRKFLNQESSVDLDNNGAHYWLTLGARGVYAL